MTPNISNLSPRDAEILARLAANGQRLFHIGDVAGYWPDRRVAHLALSRLARGGWIKRIERGRYMLIPLDAGPSREWAEDALLIAMQLANPAAIAYWSALRYWNFTEQLPRTVFVQSTARRANPEIIISGVRYRFVIIGDDRFFGLHEWAVNGQSIWVTDREKTIIDAAARPDLCGGAAQLVQSLQAHWRELDWAKLDAYAARFASGAVFKRLGYLVEALDLDIDARPSILTHWQSQLTSGVARLDPSQPSKGIVCPQWRTCDNLEHPLGRGAAR